MTAHFPSRRLAMKLLSTAALTAGLAGTTTSCAADGAPSGGDVPDEEVRPPNVVDLTHTLTPQFPYIPVPGITFPFELVPIATLASHGVAANRWIIHEHIGTQIDAPSHFIPGGRSLDQLAASELLAPLAVMDIRSRATDDPDAAVTVEDILQWEQRHGPLPADCAVFMYSGWESRLPDAATFVNPDPSGIPHFPGFSPAAAQFLARQRRVRGIGVDTLSLDPGRDTGYTTHKEWLATGKWGVECVASLGSVPATGATVFVGATKVGAATGGPVRIIATWPGRPGS